MQLVAFSIVSFPLPLRNLDFGDEHLECVSQLPTECLNLLLSATQLLSFPSTPQTCLDVQFLSQPHFGLSVRMKLTLPKVGTWSPPRLPKI